MNSDVYLTYCTFPDEESAARLCRQLVAEDLVACANLVGPARSFYKWQDTLHDEREWVAILKTTAFKRAKLKEKIQAEHPYANPCLVFLKLDDGLPEYLRWICSRTGGEAPSL